MILCVAVDEKNGMTFHHRRQSQDKCLRNYLLELVQSHNLWMNAYTAKQFEEPLPEVVRIDEHCLEKAKEEDYCFVENLSVKEYQEQIKKVILFQWNRVYPADTYFDIPLSEGGWKLMSSLDFEGNSHEKITVEEWLHEENL